MRWLQVVMKSPGRPLVWKRCMVACREVQPAHRALFHGLANDTSSVELDVWEDRWVLEAPYKEGSVGSSIEVHALEPQVAMEHCCHEGWDLLLLQDAWVDVDTQVVRVHGEIIPNEETCPISY